LQYWKITALIGTLVFVFSAFLPLLTAGVLGFSLSVNLIDFYRAIGYLIGQSRGSVPDWGSSIPLPTEAYAGAIGILLTLILYPITVILGFVSIAKKRVSLAAGILGIICWAGAVIMVTSLQSLSGSFSGLIQYGNGIFVGFIGAIILLVTHFLKLTKTVSQPIPPPPPPS
jgi:hypothetical protein